MLPLSFIWPPSGIFTPLAVRSFGQLFPRFSKKFSSKLQKKKNGNGMFMSQIYSCQVDLGYKPYSIMVRTPIADMNTRVGQHDTI